MLYHLGSPSGSDGKETSSNVKDQGSIPGLTRTPGEGKGYPLQYSCLQKSMDRGDGWATVHGVTHKEPDMTGQLTHFVIYCFYFLQLIHTTSLQTR